MAVAKSIFITFAQDSPTKRLEMFADDKSHQKNACIVWRLIMVRKMEISLLLGAYGTGNDARLSALGKRNAELRRRGIVIWGPDVTRRGLFAGLLKDPRHLVPTDDHLGDRSAKRVQMRLSGLQREGIHRVIVADDNMFGTSRQNLQSGTLYEQAVARLARFVPAFAGHDLRLALCIRSYETFWATAIAQQLSCGHGLPARGDLDRLAFQPRRWYEVIRNLSRVFPQAEIRVQSYEQTGRAPRAQFGFDPASQHSAPTDAKTLAATLRAEGDLIGAGRLAAMRGRFMPFSTAQIKAMKADYRADLAWLKAGADGLATYVTPTGDNLGGFVDIRGRHHDQEERRLVRTG